VRQLAQAALDQAIALLRCRREVMDRLVEALIDEETLHTDRFLALAGIDETATAPTVG
jgi:Peptidase family M41.